MPDRPHFEPDTPLPRPRDAGDHREIFLLGSIAISLKRIADRLDEAPERESVNRLAINRLTDALNRLSNRV